MSAYCSEEDDRVVWMTQRATCGEVVGGGPGGRCDAYTVSLHAGEMLVIAEDLKTRHCYATSASAES